MEDRQKEALIKKLSAMTGKTVELENRVDPTLIGGIRLRYGGVQLDDTIRSRLDTLRRSLGDAII
jgi:F-type H+-transporting ATPase subunit delta